ncbi:hypothetical protein [Aliterella atlantica]|uniref:Uncharacterized protein n=1 Tax=Aliterella atlantica CENA595 TaxID=1618023 RepID=A0A0D8ZTH9_9CYAN|nr:hypothetical protein [Aliterella atlantica]KJH72050.1 hypothetical protein UH38_08200 [Aliterella atlantica CENA595]
MGQPKEGHKLMLLALRLSNKKLNFCLKNVAGLALSMMWIAAITNSAQAAQEKARRADDFVNSIGVNTHLYYDASIYYKRYNDLIKPKLLELGVRHIRDGCTRNYNGYMTRLKELKNLGIRTTLVCDPRYLSASSAVSLVKEIGTDVIESVQVTNEYNLSGDGNWANNLRNYQKQLWQGMKGSSSTAGIKIYGPALSGASAYSTLGDMSAYQDYGTMNNYMSGRNPGNSGWGGGGYGSLDWNVRSAKKASLSKPVLTTETGYHSVVSTSNGHRGIPDDVAGKYTPRLALVQFNYGIPRTFIYEFLNTYYDPGSLYMNFGLLRNDGSQKPAYGALKNLINLLKDPGASFTPGTLDYVLGGDTTNIRRTLLQKRDGKFYLILWKEALGYNVDTKKYISVPSQKVTVTLNTSISKATTYIPNDSANYKSSQTYPKQLSIDVPDRVVVIKLEK